MSIFVDGCFWHGHENCIEIGVTGAIKRKERFRTYIKVPELAAFLREIIDYRTAEMINLDVPDKRVRFLTGTPTAEQEDMITRLMAFAGSGNLEDLGLDSPAPENVDKAKMLVATDVARYTYAQRQVQR